jgi:2-polyprenyl-3-methyl-5-hydroxy-6-metoxy-1,4-benzoquinol methylase
MRRAVEETWWAPLDKSGHYGSLIKLLDVAFFEGCKTLIDVGCGVGTLQELPYVREHFTATGVDLPDVVDKAAIPLNPNGHFIRCDIVDDEPDISFLGGYDLVIMNGFIDVMQHPLHVLDRILKHCKGHVLLHRQYLTEGPTYLTMHDSYGGESYDSHINRRELDDVLEHNYVGIKRICLRSNEEWPDIYSFLWDVTP